MGSTWDFVSRTSSGVMGMCWNKYTNTMTYQVCHGQVKTGIWSYMVIHPTNMIHTEWFLM